MKNKDLENDKCKTCEYRVKNAEWVDTKIFRECSNCGYRVVTDLSLYCPGCGSKMEYNPRVEAFLW